MLKNVILAASIILTVGCSPFRLALSEDLNNSREMPVKGKDGILINQKLSFGPYHTLQVKRSWTSGGSATGGAQDIFWVKRTQKQQSIHFSLTDSMQNTSQVFCLAKVRNEDFTVGGNPNSVVNIMGEVLGLDGYSDDTYAVSIYLAKQPAPWQLLLDVEQSQRNAKTYIGYLAQSKTAYYTLHPLRSLQKNGKTGVMPFGSIGFEVRNKEGKPLAAISNINKGVVYLADVSPEEKFLLANACAALLLHQTLS